jgi:hypothetical protein
MDWKKLAISILLDVVGLLSFEIPLWGEFQDVIWAPLSAYILMKMYPGSVGKIAGMVEFVEEILPFTDVVPTFTITFFYNTFFKKN